MKQGRNRILVHVAMLMEFFYMLILLVVEDNIAGFIVMKKIVKEFFRGKEERNSSQ